MDRFYLAVDIDNPDWREVTKEEYVRAERAAGFRNTLGQPDEPATAGFSACGVLGRTAYVREGDHELQI